MSEYPAHCQRSLKQFQINMMRTKVSIKEIS
jgi:hypothetical protein